MASGNYKMRVYYNDLFDAVRVILEKITLHDGEEPSVEEFGDLPQRGQNTYCVQKILQEQYLGGHVVATENGETIMRMPSMGFVFRVGQVFTWTTEVEAKRMCLAMSLAKWYTITAGQEKRILDLSQNAVEYWFASCYEGDRTRAARDAFRIFIQKESDSSSLIR